MLRQVQGGHTPYPGATVVAPLGKGGTGKSTDVEAVENLGGIHKSKLGVRNGILRGDQNGNIPESILGDQTAFGYSVDGPLSLVHGEIADYFVTNFSSNRPILVSVNVGSVSVVDEDTIRIQAPTSGNEVLLTIGPRSISIPLSPAGPARPALETVTPIEMTRIFYSTEFRGEPLSFSDWITVEAGVTNPVIQENVYAIEIRGQKGTTGVSKFTMNGIDYSCGLAKTNRKIPLVNGAATSFTVSGTGSLQYRTISTALKHISTDWEIATEESFTNIVKSSYNDTVNKLLWEVTLPSGNYYLRFRHKGSTD